MDRADIRETHGPIWLNNQQAIPPSEAVQESFRSHMQPFIQTFSPKGLLQETEEAARALVGCRTSLHTFHPIPYYPHAGRIIVAALLEHAEAFQGKNHLLVSSHEQQWLVDALCRRHGLGTTYDWVTVSKEGRLHPDQLVEALSPRTLLFSVSAANGLTGLVEPIKELHSLCRERGVIFHLDLSDILGRSALTPEMLDADILTFSSLALGGMGSIGGMFIRRTLANYFSGWLPPIPSGSFCFGSLAAMKTACQERSQAFSSLVLSSQQLRSKLSLLSKEIPQAQVLFTDASNRLPNVHVVAIPSIAAESIGFFLQQQNIYLGLGYERFPALSQVLQNCGISPFLCHSALHFSFTERTTLNMLDPVFAALRDGLKHLHPLTASSL